MHLKKVASTPTIIQLGQPLLGGSSQALLPYVAEAHRASVGGLMEQVLGEHVQELMQTHVQTREETKLTMYAPNS